MRAFFQKHLSGLTVNDYVILSLVFFTFVSFYVQTALLILLPFYVLFSKQVKKALPKNAIDWFLLVFALSACLSTFLFAKEGEFYSFTIKVEYLKILSVLVIFFVFDLFFLSSVMTKRVFMLGLKLAAVMSIFSFAVSLYQTVFQLYPDSENRPGRVASVFFNENYYGMMLEFLILITLFLIFKMKDKLSSRIFFSLIFALNVASLWLCKSRMAFIIVALTSFIYLFFDRGKQSFIVLVLIALLCLLVINQPTILPRFDSTSDYLHYRFGIWQTAIESFTETPLLGRGYFSYGSIWLGAAVDEYFEAPHAHNFYIDILLNFGIFGAVFFSVFTIGKFYQCIKNCLNAGLRSELALVIATIVAVLVHGVADCTILWPQTCFMAVFLLACPNVYLEKE